MQPMKELKELNDKFAERSKIWYNLESYSKNYEIWFKNDFKTLDFDSIEKTIKLYDGDCAMAKARITLLSKDNSDKVLNSLQAKVRMISGYLPIIMALGNKDLTENHWMQILDQLDNGEMLKENLKSKRPFCLQELIASRIEDHREFVEEISARASGEAQIEADLDKIKREWMELNFEVEPYRTYNCITLIFVH